MLTGIVAAAGRGRRMGTLTDDRPKCMLSVGGATVLDHIVDSMMAAGSDEVLVVVGYREELIRAHVDSRSAWEGRVQCVTNPMGWETNLLHSIMQCRSHTNCEVLISYSDVVIPQRVYCEVARADGTVNIAVDHNWFDAYDGRHAHPPAEAEKVARDSGRVAQIGKHLVSPHPARDFAEFIGLAKIAQEIWSEFASLYAELEARDPSAPFGQAKRLRDAYLTDLLQHYLDSGRDINAMDLQAEWVEIDTAEDYDRAIQLTLERTH